MRLLPLLLFLAPIVWADFYIVHDDQQTKMVPLASGKVDYSTLNLLPMISPDAAIHAFSDDTNVNKKHMNFRTATIALIQSNTSVDIYTTKQHEKMVIEFGKRNFQEGMILQLFYHNAWYGVALGDPRHGLYTLLGNDQSDPEHAYEAAVDAQKAYPDDKQLDRLSTLWKTRYQEQQQKERMETIRELEKFYANKPSRFFAQQLQQEIGKFEQTYPDSMFHDELEQIKRALPQQ